MQPSADFTIRRSEPADLPAIPGMYDEAIVWLNANGISEQWGTTPVSARPHLLRELSNFVAFGHVAEGSQLLGFIAFDRDAPPHFEDIIDKESQSGALYIHTLVALRISEARGIGAALLAFAEANACAASWASSP